MKKHLLYICILLCSASSCSSFIPLEESEYKANYALETDASNLPKWKLERIRKGTFDGFKTPDMNLDCYIQIDWDSLRYNGYSGCNSFSGKIEHNKNKLKFVRTMGTQRGCPPKSMESILYTTLSLIDNYTMLGNTLTLKQGNVILISYKRK